MGWKLRSNSAWSVSGSKRKMSSLGGSDVVRSSRALPAFSNSQSVPSSRSGPRSGGWYKEVRGGRYIFFGVVIQPSILGGPSPVAVPPSPAVSAPSKCRRGSLSGRCCDRRRLMGGGWSVRGAGLWCLPSQYSGWNCVTTQEKWTSGASVGSKGRYCESCRSCRLEVKLSWMPSRQTMAGSAMWRHNWFGAAESMYASTVRWSVWGNVGGSLAGWAFALRLPIGVSSGPGWVEASRGQGVGRRLNTAMRSGLA